MKTVRDVVTRPCEPGHYFHFGFLTGIVRSLFHLSLPVIPNQLGVSINIDGIPLTKSSNGQFWPILGMIRGFKEAKPFVIGIYQGNGKPQNVNDYLLDFVNKAKTLQTDGFLFKECKVLVSIVAFVCDAPARSFMSCVKGHTSYFGCSKYETKGEYFNPNVNHRMGGRVTYPNLKLFCVLMILSGVVYSPITTLVFQY